VPYERESGKMDEAVFVRHFRASLSYVPRFGSVDDCDLMKELPTDANSDRF
jgi:hypothetical protein